MLIHINPVDITDEKNPDDKAFYQIILLKESVEVSVDFTPYKITAPALLFLSPYQHIDWKVIPPESATQLSFHGDFYCIEYHKQEVACNGLLFNNIYLRPYVTIDAEAFTEIENTLLKIQKEISGLSDFSETLVKAYLQVILALSSKEKMIQIEKYYNTLAADNYEANEFQKLLEAHFMTEKSVNFYADKLHLNINSFSKKIKNNSENLRHYLFRNGLYWNQKSLFTLPISP
ncbi:AraC family transcriptional regulator [Elizabethkingia meningoseptica ATCC 13253 = NBRC 12535]|nr:hypothetical protein [Elizabethkingia meningoseptica]EOR29368.1 AraC family transcriptional regulator [Elizabethkingia meningoseptica ATCC 13253 = NBRC 12535]